MAAASSQRNQRMHWGVFILVPMLWWILLPPFHIVPIGKIPHEIATQSFDPDAIVEKFWSEDLPGLVDAAVDAGMLMAKLEEDREAAAKQYGHRLGLSGKSVYFVSGNGWVQDIQGSKILIALSEGGAVSVLISKGPVFGNAVRDGSGLLNVSDYGNSQNFNSISLEINRRVEERVLPLLDERVEKGSKIHFVGGVEVSDHAASILPLKIIPVRIELP